MGHTGEHGQDAVAARGVGTVLSAAGREPAHSGTAGPEGVADTAVGQEKESTELARRGGDCTEVDLGCHMAQAGVAAVVHVLRLATEHGVDWGAEGRGAAAGLADSADWDMRGRCAVGEETAGSVEAAGPAVGRGSAGETLMQQEVVA